MHIKSSVDFLKNVGVLAVVVGMTLAGCQTDITASKSNTYLIASGYDVQDGPIFGKDSCNPANGVLVIGQNSKEMTNCLLVSDKMSKVSVYRSVDDESPDVWDVSVNDGVIRLYRQDGSLVVNENGANLLN